MKPNEGNDDINEVLQTGGEETTPADAVAEDSAANALMEDVADPGSAAPETSENTANIEKELAEYLASLPCRLETVFDKANKIDRELGDQLYG